MDRDEQSQAPMSNNLSLAPALTREEKASSEPVDTMTVSFTESTPQQSDFADQQGEADTAASRSLLNTVVWESLQIVLPAILLALVTHIFFAQATVVYGQSMQPSLNPMERLVIEKVSYYLHAPERNDIVVISLPHMSELLIKRVVGLPGETVEIHDGTLYINGIAQEEGFNYVAGHANFGPVTLRPMTYFVMGDNRDNSNDSRAFGPVSLDTILGRAWLRYWPARDFTVFK